MRAITKFESWEHALQHGHCGNIEPHEFKNWEIEVEDIQVDNGWVYFISDDLHYRADIVETIA